MALVENATVAWQLAFYSLPFRARRPHPHGDGRVCQQLHRLSCRSARRARRCRRASAERRRAARSTSAALERMIDGRARLIAITHLPTNGGLVNPAEAIGRVARAARHPLSARCLPVDRADADRRRGDRLRHPLRHRAQISPRAARHRVPLCAPRRAGAHRAALPRPAGARAGRRPTATSCGPMRGASRTGRAMSPASSGSASRSTMRSAGALAAIAARVVRIWPRRLRERLRAIPGVDGARHRPAALRHRQLHGRRNGCRPRSCAASAPTR